MASDVLTPRTKGAVLGALLLGSAGFHPAGATVLTTDASAGIRASDPPYNQVNFFYHTPDATQVAGPPAGQVLSDSQRTSNGKMRLLGYATEDGLIGAYAATTGSAGVLVDTKIHTTVTAGADGKLIGTFHFNPFYLALRPTSSIPGTNSASWSFSISGGGQEVTAFVGLIEDATATPHPSVFTSGMAESALNLQESGNGGLEELSGNIGTLTLDFGFRKAGESFDLDYDMMAGARTFEDASPGTAGGGQDACMDPVPPLNPICFITPFAIASGSDPFAFGNSADASGFLAGERARFGEPAISFTIRPAIAVSEPGTIGLLGAGLVSLGLRRRGRA